MVLSLAAVWNTAWGAFYVTGSGWSGGSWGTWQQMSSSMTYNGSTYYYLEVTANSSSFSFKIEKNKNYDNTISPNNRSATVTSGKKYRIMIISSASNSSASVLVQQVITNPAHIYVLKTNASICTFSNYTARSNSGYLWAWDGSNVNFMGSSNYNAAPSTTTTYTDANGNVWYDFCSTTTDASTAFYIIWKTAANGGTKMYDGENNPYKDGSNGTQKPSFTGAAWIVPNGTSAGSARAYSQNPSPVISGIANKSVNVGSSVAMGTSCSSPTNGSKTYAWTLASSAYGSFSSTTAVNPSYTGSTPGSTTATLTVTQKYSSAQVATTAGTCTITVNCNTATITDLASTSELDLNGASNISFSPTVTITGDKTIAWTKTSGPSGTFSSTNTAATTFTPSGNGTYVLKITVTQGSCTASASTTLTVTTSATPSVTLKTNAPGGGGAPMSIGSQVTLTATPANTTATPTYKFRYKITPDGTPSAWSTSQSSNVYSGFYCLTNGTNESTCHYFQVQMTHDGTTYESAWVKVLVSDVVANNTSETIQLGGTANMTLSNAAYTTNSATISHESGTPSGAAYTLGSDYTFTKVGTWTMTATSTYTAHGANYSKTNTKTVTVSTPTVTCSNQTNIALGTAVTISPTYTNADNCTKTITITAPSGASTTYNGTSYTVAETGTHNVAISVTYGGTEVASTTATITVKAPTITCSNQTGKQLGQTITVSPTYTNADNCTKTISVTTPSGASSSYTAGANYTITELGTYTFTINVSYGGSVVVTKDVTVKTSSPTITCSNQTVGVGTVIQVNPTYANADNCTKTITVTKPDESTASYTANSNFTCSEAGKYYFDISVKYSGTEVATKRVTITVKEYAVIYILKTKGSNSSLTGVDLQTLYGFWAWRKTDNANFYSDISAWNNRPTTSSAKASTYTDTATGNVWWKFTSDNIFADETYGIIILCNNNESGDDNRIIQTEWISSETPVHINGNVVTDGTNYFKGTSWFVPHGCTKNGVYAYTNYPDCATPTYTLTANATLSLPASGEQSVTKTITVSNLTNADVANIKWTRTPTTNCSLSSASGTASTTLTATKSGTYTVTCTVKNSCGSTTTKTCVVTVNCPAPVITPGTTSHSIKSDGTLSLSPTATNTTTYAWSRVSGSEGSFSSTNTASTVFTPKANTAQTYTLRLTATNACGGSTTQDYTVVVCTSATFADTNGFSRSINLNDALSVSLDPTITNGGSTYAWSLVSGPAGSSFSSTTTKATTFSFITAGKYVVRISVNGTNACSSDTYTKDYTINVSGEMPKVKLHVVNESNRTDWDDATTIYAYYTGAQAGSAATSGYVPLTWNSTSKEWYGEIEKSQAVLGYRLYVTKTNSGTIAVRTYDNNSYGYIDIPAGSANYKDYYLEITPRLNNNNTRYGLREQCVSFTLSDQNIGEVSANTSLAVSVATGSLPANVSYQWNCVSGDGGDALLSSQTVANPTFQVANANGRYVYEVTVQNNNSDGCYGIALITVEHWQSKTYYLKHPSSGTGNGSWTWTTMTSVGNGKYTCTGRYYDGVSGANVSTDKKIRVTMIIGDVGTDIGFNGDASAPYTLEYFNNGSGNWIANSSAGTYNEQAYYQFLVPENASFWVHDKYWVSNDDNLKSHQTEDHAGKAGDIFVHVYSQNKAYNEKMKWSSDEELPSWYVRHDGYRDNEHILNHEQARGNVIWIYDEFTDELSIMPSGTLYRLGAQVPNVEPFKFAGSATNEYFSNYVKAAGTGEANKMSLFVAAGAEVRLYTSTNGGASWNYANKTFSAPSATESGVWVTNLATTTTIGAWTKYEGDFWVRSRGVLNNLGNYKNNDAKFTAFEPDRSFVNEYYNHYWVKWCNHGENISAMVANQYNPDIAGEIPSYTIGDGDDGGANIRYSYDNTTNHFGYSLLNGSTAHSDYLTIFGGDNVYKSTATATTKSRLLQSDKYGLVDMSDWVYTAELKAEEHATIRLLGHYYHSTGVATPRNMWLLGNNTTLLEILTANNPNDLRNMLVSYDYKTNRIVAGWIPDGDKFNSGETTIEANLILRREMNNDTKTFDVNGTASIKGLKRAYFYFILKPNNNDVTALDANKNLFWFSVPFECKISDAFGLSGYNTDWVIQRYRGDARAQYSWTINIPTFWNNAKSTYTLKAGEGYAFSFKAANIDFPSVGHWDNGVLLETVRQKGIFFPSVAANIGDVKAQSRLAEYPEMICEAQGGARKGEDSNWRVIGPIAFENVAPNNGTPADDSFTSPYGANAFPNFLYIFNDVFQKGSGNNSPIALTSKGASTGYYVENGKTFTYKPCYSYMTQFAGTIDWAAAGRIATPSFAPRRRAENTPANVYHNEDYTLRLFDSEQGLVDQTIVLLQTDASDEFNPGEDLFKFRNNTAALFTLVGNTEAAGNALEYKDQEVPLTVVVPEAGQYTVELTEGVSQTASVVLVDHVENIRTELTDFTYTANLPAGEVKDRFTLIFTVGAKPQSQQPTGLAELTGNMLVRVVDGRINVEGIEGSQNIMLFDAAGRLISNEQAADEWKSAALPQGVYMLRIGTHTTKVVL